MKYLLVVYSQPPKPEPSAPGWRAGFDCTRMQVRRGMLLEMLERKNTSWSCITGKEGQGEPNPPHTGPQIVTTDIDLDVRGECGSEGRICFFVSGRTHSFPPQTPAPASHTATQRVRPKLHVTSNEEFHSPSSTQESFGRKTSGR